MFIKNIQVLNYRRFINETMDFEQDVTFVAGANNSGKTSLMSLLKDVLTDRKNTYSFDDLPISIQSIFFKEIECEINKLKEDFDANRTKFEEKIKTLAENYQTQVRLNVSYNDGDAISRFTSYYMDLDKDIRDFYFVYLYKLDIPSFLSDFFEKRKFFVADADFTSEKSKMKFKKEIIKTINNNLVNKIYYCDCDYKNMNLIERKSLFLDLFNIVPVQANRPLDDIDDDRNYGLSSTMIKILKNDDAWDKDKNKVVDQIESALDDIKNKVQTITDNALTGPLKQIEKTSGKEKTKVTLSLNPKTDELERFIIGTMEAVYNIDGAQLGENSQGLGYSNLIFIHLKFEDFIKKIDKTKVNLFIIEEPESHMHPQMQRIFINYFINELNNNPFSQGMISTHSNEIVKNAKMHRIRVIRKDNSMSYIKSLKPLVDIKDEDDVETKEVKDFFNYFFDVAFSEIIFADKAVFYEGDTERLYIQNLIKNDTVLEELRNQYISYIQVGGAYAHKYRGLIELLQIPSLVITDIDYDQNEINVNNIKLKYTENPAIKDYYKSETGLSDYTCEKLYEWKNNKKNVINNLIYIAFQTDEDNYTRTLEEAMICKKMNIVVDKSLSWNEWDLKRKEFGWTFSLPNTKKEDKDDKSITVREILKSSSSQKINFMYSIILKKDVLKCEPNYIVEGLKWLMS